MKVLIVGAGIAGLLMYRELKKRHIAVDIIEKEPRLNAVGAGICLPGNAMHWFEQLGLKQAIVKKAHQVDEVRYETHERKLLASASLLQGVLNTQPFVALPRGELLTILADGILDEIQFGRSIAKISTRSGTENVHFNDGTVTQYNLVIGADGIDSKVRELSFNTPELLDLNVTNWRFVVDMPTSDLAPSYLVGKTDAFMFYPIGENKVYCYAQAANDQIDGLFNDDKKNMLSIFDSYHDSVKTAINKAEHIAHGRLKSVESREVYQSHCVLIGDALHGCPPSLQQGVAQTLEDVVVLSRCLDMQNDIQTALEQFKKSRLKDVSWVIDESNKVIQLAQLGKSKLGCFIRNTLIKLQGPQNVKAWRKLMTAQEIR